MAGTLQVLLLVAWIMGLSAADSGFTKDLYSNAVASLFEPTIPEGVVPSIRSTNAGNKLIEMTLRRDEGHRDEMHLWLEGLSFKCPLDNTASVITVSNYPYCLQSASFKVHAVDSHQVIEMTTSFFSDDMPDKAQKGFLIVTLIFPSASSNDENFAQANAVNVQRLFATENPQGGKVEYDLTWIEQVAQGTLIPSYTKGGNVMVYRGSPIIVDKPTFAAYVRFIKGETVQATDAANPQQLE